MYIENTTKLDGTSKTGDEIKAQVTEKGHAEAMKYVESMKEPR